jgi:hypothetical protein
VNEVDRLIDVLRQRFSTVPPLSDTIWLQSPAVKVIDCVLSLNRRYDRVILPRVQRFARNHPDIQALSPLRTLITRYNSPLDFSSAELDYNDQRRAETLLGMVDYLLAMQQEYEGCTEAERLAQWAVWARPGDYLAVGVPGFGLAGFQYLRMLFGAQTTKPDVHIIRFVSEAVGRKVTAVQALYLLERAAKHSGLPVRELDSAIWKASARSGKPTPHSA